MGAKNLLKGMAAIHNLMQIFYCSSSELVLCLPLPKLCRCGHLHGFEDEGDSVREVLDNHPLFLYVLITMQTQENNQGTLYKQT